MKILNKVKDNDFPLVVDCVCGTKLEIEKNDVDKYCCVTCPICGEDIDVREYTDECKIRKEDITFPLVFYHFGDKNSVPIDDAKINKWIQEGFNFLEAHPDCGLWYTNSGNSLVIMIDEDDSIRIFVAQGFYEGFYDK